MRGIIVEKIYNKINNHRCLDNDDIKRFIYINSKGRVSIKFLDTKDCPVYYDSNINTIVIDQNFRNTFCKYRFK